TDPPLDSKIFRVRNAHLYRLVRELTPGNGSIERHTPPHDHLLLADWKSVCLVTLVIDRNHRLRLLRFYSPHASSFVVQLLQLLRPQLRFGMASQNPTHQITVVRVRNGRTRRGPVAVVAASGRQGAPHPNGVQVVDNAAGILVGVAQASQCTLELLYQWFCLG